MKGASPLSVPGVYFTCPLTGATLTRGEREAHVKEAILMVRPLAVFGKKIVICIFVDAAVCVDKTRTVVPGSALRRML